MNTATVTLENIDAETLGNSLASLEAGESLDELTGRLLRRFIESRDVTIAAERESVGRAVARAFRDCGRR